MSGSMQAEKKQDTESVVLTLCLSGSHCWLDSTPYNYIQFDNENSFRMGFDGCAFTHGILGGLFGYGLKEQCRSVKAKVDSLITRFPGKKIILNCHGFSRGAIASLLLAKMLRDIPKDRLEINLALIDPVPGNSFLATKLDIFSLTLANQTKDVSDCVHIKRALCVYATQPAPFMAPLLPILPSTCKIDYRVIRGDHPTVLGRGHADALDFLSECGTQFSSVFSLAIDPSWPSCPSETTLRACHSHAGASIRAEGDSIQIDPPDFYSPRYRPRVLRGALFIGSCLLSLSGFLLFASMLVILYTLPSFTLASVLMWIGIDLSLIAGIVALCVADYQKCWGQTTAYLEKGRVDSQDARKAAQYSGGDKAGYSKSSSPMLPEAPSEGDKQGLVALFSNHTK